MKLIKKQHTTLSFAESQTNKANQIQTPPPTRLADLSSLQSSTQQYCSVCSLQRWTSRDADSLWNSHLSHTCVIHNFYQCFQCVSLVRTVGICAIQKFIGTVYIYSSPGIDRLLCSSSSYRVLLININFLFQVNC